MKSGIEIEQDIYVLANAYFKDKIKGKVYRDEMRPINSEQEDLVVTFHTALDGQFQTGTVNLNLFVPKKFISNKYLKDIARITHLSKEMVNFKEQLKIGEYRYLSGSTIQDFDCPDEVNQHKINFRLYFNRKTF